MGNFVIKSAAKGKGVKFDLKAPNGQVIASSQVYASMKSCKNGIASVVRNAPIAPIEDQTDEGAHEINPKFELYTDKAGEYRFRLKAANGQIIATGEGYKAKKSCLNGIESIRKNAVDAPIEVEE